MAVTTNQNVTGIRTGSGGGGTWGSITGTLSSQTDLQAALDAKLNKTSGTFTSGIVATSLTASYATASTIAVFDSSKNLISSSYAATTALLSNFVGDSGSGGTKGLVPAPASGDAAASKFLKADGTWTAVAAGGVTSVNSLIGALTIASGTSGTDFAVSPTGTTITLNLPVASGSNTGKLSSTDWSTFNGKQASGNYITALTGDVTASGPGSSAATIGSNKVTLGMLAQVATATFHGRTTASTGNVESLTATQATALLINFVGDSGSGGTKGLVPAPASGDAAALKFLKADGTWAAPAGGLTGSTGAVDNSILRADGTGGSTLQAGGGVTLSDTAVIAIPTAITNSVASNAITFGSTGIYTVNGNANRLNTSVQEFNLVDLSFNKFFNWSVGHYFMYPTAGSSAHYAALNIDATTGLQIEVLDTPFQIICNSIVAFKQSTAGLITIGATSSTQSHSVLGRLGITVTAGTGTITPGFVLTEAAHTALTASTERFDSNFNSARTVQWATGALTTQRFNVFQAPTIGFVGASTVTDTATVAITGAPVKGTNATLTNTHALLIQAGAVSTATNSYGLTVNAQTGATNNYAAKFLGGNVGIGFGAPVSKLHIDAGDATASTLRFTAGTTTGQTATDGFTVGITAAGVAEMKQLENNDFFFYNNGRSIPTIQFTAAGNVAIGTDFANLASLSVSRDVDVISGISVGLGILPTITDSVGGGTFYGMAMQPNLTGVNFSQGVGALFGINCDTVGVGGDLIGLQIGVSDSGSGLDHVYGMDTEISSDGVTIALVGLRCGEPGGGATPTLRAALEVDGTLAIDQTDDASSGVQNALALIKAHTHLTGNPTINGFSSVSQTGQYFILTCSAGMTINNQNVLAAAADRIITGSGAALVFVTDGACVIKRDSTNSRWRVVSTLL